MPHTISALALVMREPLSTDVEVLCAHNLTKAAHFTKPYAHTILTNMFCIVFKEGSTEILSVLVLINISAELPLGKLLETGSIHNMTLTSSKQSSKELLSFPAMYISISNVNFMYTYVHPITLSIQMCTLTDYQWAFENSQQVGFLEWTHVVYSIYYTSRCHINE